MGEENEGRRNTWNGGPLTLDEAGIAGSCIGIGMWLISIAIGFCLARDQGGDQPLTAGEKLWAMAGWHGPDALRAHVNRQHHPEWTANNCADEQTAFCSWTTIPIYWGFLLKYLIPTMLMTMLANGIREDHYTPYGGFSERQNGLGLSGYIIGLILMISPVLCPIVFMSNKDAWNFEGWDLMVSIGLDPRNFECLGFYHPDDEEAGMTDHKREPKNLEMESVPAPSYK